MSREVLCKTYLYHSIKSTLSQALVPSLFVMSTVMISMISCAPMEEDAALEGYADGGEGAGTTLDNGTGTEAPQAGGGYNNLEDCTLRATRQLSQEEMLNEVEVRVDEICLDRLDFGSQWCQRAEDIEFTINTYTFEPERVMSCTDRDSDCYYSCTGWTLHPALEDPDDRRASVTGDLEARAEVNRSAEMVDPVVDDGQMEVGNLGDAGVMNENIPAAEEPSRPMFCRGEADDSALSPSVQTCLYDLNQGEIPLEQIWPCENDGVAWLSTDLDGQKILTLGHLSADEYFLDRQSYPINFTPSEVACHLDPSSDIWSVVALSREGQELRRLNEGDFILIDLMEETASLSLDNALFSDLELQLSSVVSLIVDASNFIWWSFSLDHQLSPDELKSIPMLGMRVDNYRTTYRVGREGVIDQRLSCNDCSANNPSPRSAYLLDDLSVVVAEGEGSETVEVSLFDNFGPFELLRSSDSLLGLGNQRENNTSLYFSLWTESLTDEASLINFPLIFDALARGYESVDLIEIKGMNALLQLAEPNVEGAEQDVKRVYAVYNALTEQFIELESLFTKEDLASLNPELELSDEEIEWSQPILYATWVSRVATIDGQSFMMVIRINQ